MTYLLSLSEDDIDILQDALAVAAAACWLPAQAERYRRLSQDLKNLKERQNA